MGKHLLGNGHFSILKIQVIIVIDVHEANTYKGGEHKLLEDLKPIISGLEERIYGMRDSL